MSKTTALSEAMTSLLGEVVEDPAQLCTLRGWRPCWNRRNEDISQYRRVSSASSAMIGEMNSPAPSHSCHRVLLVYEPKWQKIETMNQIKRFLLTWLSQARERKSPTHMGSGMPPVFYRCFKCPLFVVLYERGQAINITQELVNFVVKIKQRQKA